MTDKKMGEARMLDAARKAGAPIPAGEIHGEEPDFTFNTENGTLGVEVTELLRPASRNHGIVPVEEENFHNEVIRTAQQQYCTTVAATPASLIVYFANAKGMRQDKRKIAQTLVDFVKENVHRANPVIALSGNEVPHGFGAMSITAGPGDWWCGESGGTNLNEIPRQLASRILAKNKLLPTYRTNLPRDARVWLLLYSRPTVARSIPVPFGIERMGFQFDFDRVFWFASLENQVVEIQRATAP